VSDAWAGSYISFSTVMTSSHARRSRCGSKRVEGPLRVFGYAYKAKFRSLLSWFNGFHFGAK
jgi:hypothetical protein